jgi:uncharacterized peroxidase-related enzyme
VLSDVFKAFPVGARALLEYHDALLRGSSPLTIAQRELLAAYVSGLNACNYCHGAHRVIAEIHGMDAQVLERLMTDPVAAGVESVLLPILGYVRKLTESPGRMTDSDAQAVYEAGWNEEALFHAISVCALFNFMNRIVEGCGVSTDQRVLTEQRERHQSMKDDPHPYQSFGARIGIA